MGTVDVSMANPTGVEVQLDCSGPTMIVQANGGSRKASPPALHTLKHQGLVANRQNKGLALHVGSFPWLMRLGNCHIIRTAGVDEQGVSGSQEVLPIPRGNGTKDLFWKLSAARAATGKQESKTLSKTLSKAAKKAKSRE